MPARRSARIYDARRLAAVHATRLLDTESEEPFDRLTALAAMVLRTPFAQVTIVDDRRSYWKSCFGLDSTDISDRSDPIGRSFCQHVVASGSSVVLPDVTMDDRTKDNPWIEFGVKAWAGFPIQTADGQIVGTFCAIDTVARIWTKSDLVALETLAHAAAGEIRLRMIAEAAVEFADNLRDSLLPAVMPHVPGLDLAGCHVPASDAAGMLGDFYDVFHSPLDVWHISIGDVCGHGVEAAKLTALARWSIQTAAASTTDPTEILATVHGVLLRHQRDRFITAQLLTLGVVDGEGLTIDMGLAGHPSALVRRVDGTVERCGLGGRVLGMVEGAWVDRAKIVLATGDYLVMSTDGLFEGRRNGVELGFERVEGALAATVGFDAAATSSALVELLATWTGGQATDDLAIVVLGPAFSN